MIIAKVCLTGGPCGGKTSALKIINDELSKLRIQCNHYK